MTINKSTTALAELAEKSADVDLLWEMIQFVAQQLIDMDVETLCGAGFPKLSAPMDEAEADVLEFMTFPKAHRTKIHSTNPLERLNAEIKRRTKVVGIFPNKAAINRLVGALLLEQYDEWQFNRRYMQLEELRSLAQNPPARLSACAQ